MMSDRHGSTTNNTLIGGTAANETSSRIRPRRRRGGRRRERAASFEIAVQIGADWLASIKDGFVTYGSQSEAARFKSRRGAWAHLGQENLPICLMNVARLVAVLARRSPECDYPGPGDRMPAIEEEE